MRKETQPVEEESKILQPANQRREEEQKLPPPCEDMIEKLKKRVSTIQNRVNSVSAGDLQNQDEQENFHQQPFGNLFGIRKYTNKKRGGIYEGEFDYTEKRHGYGKMLYQNGDVYVGFWYRDNKHDYGIYEWKDGSSYRGGWNTNMRHGTGKHIFPNGDEQRGTFQNDHFDKCGLYWEKDTYAFYEGEFKSGKRHRNGLQVYYEPGNLVEYDGEWKDGVKHGNGTMSREMEPNM